MMCRAATDYSSAHRDLELGISHLNLDYPQSYLIRGLKMFESFSRLVEPFGGLCHRLRQRRERVLGTS